MFIKRAVLISQVEFDKAIRNASKEQSQPEFTVNSEKAKEAAHSSGNSSFAFARMLF